MAPTIITKVVVGAATPSAGSAIDLVDLQTIKDDIGISAPDYDTALARWITAASRAVQNYCFGRLDNTGLFAQQTYQEQFWALRDPYPWQLPSGFFPLQLARFPLATGPSPAGTAPPNAPTLAAVAGGTLASATYYVKTTYVTAAGETAASIESSLAVAADNLVQVAAPAPDPLQAATGWNVYIGTSSFGETRQNASPLGLTTAFTLPTSGLVAGAALPSYVLVVENNPLAPTPLAEGIDFFADATHGWLTRLFQIDASPRRWSSLPITVVYPAGYSTIPEDVQEAVILLVKKRWFARQRDPQIRQENISGVYEATYWFGAGPGSTGNLPPDVQELLDAYRVPVIG